ncbi:hypothetical protein GCM10027054_19210 [Isoptericola nanjingensis]
MQEAAVDLFKIQHELIADRTADAWYRIRIAGPSFHYRWDFGSGPSGAFSNISDEHHSHAVCREEPNLTMSWGMNVYSREERNELHFDWAEGFVNPSVRPFWVDFFWNNALIDRVELCRIDGGHGTIPIPAGREVTDFETSVAYLVHDLEEGPDHDHPGRYLETLNIKRIRDSDRWGAGSQQ